MRRSVGHVVDAVDGGGGIQVADGVLGGVEVGLVAGGREVAVAPVGLGAADVCSEQRVEVDERVDPSFGYGVDGGGVAGGVSTHGSEPRPGPSATATARRRTA